MDANERRQQILQLLNLDIKPISATALADKFEVSRQIIVGDIALLRAAGNSILATPRGYLLNKADSEDPNAADTYVVACRHDKGQLEHELYTIVDNGGSLLNVTVEHPIYGNISQELNVHSRYDADKLLNRVAVSGATLLCSLTDGVHLHTLRCPDADSYRRILTALRDQGILYTK